MPRPKAHRTRTIRPYFHRTRRTIHRAKPIPASTVDFYRSKPALLTRGELWFYRALRDALQGHLGVSFKTRLADILHCPDTLWNTAYGRRLAQKHVDFVLFDPDTTAILAVLELDDRSHDIPERQQRDRFLNQALKGARIPLLRVRAAATYDRSKLRESIGLLFLPPVSLNHQARRSPHN